MTHQTVILKRRRKRPAPQRSAGSWKVAYADFLTAMMAFFMVMWIMGLSDETRAIVAGYFSDPLGFMKNDTRSRKVIATPGMKSAHLDLRDGAAWDEEQMRNLRQQIRSEMLRAAEGAPELAGIAENVELSITEEGLRIEFIEAAGAVFFESGSAKIRPNAAPLIRRLGPVLRSSKRGMILEGHTDTAPYPSDTYTNWDLSTDRANSFRRALHLSGVEPGQFESVTGYADTRLRTKGIPTHFSNRRVSLLLPFRGPAERRADLPREAFRGRVDKAFRWRVPVAPDGIRLNTR